MISEDVKNQILSEARDRIVEVIGDHVSLSKGSGTNMVGLCPFHSEKTGSFNVNTQRGTYHCFGCGAGGDAVAFIRKLAGKSFPEALTYLGERLGIEVDERKDMSPEEKKAAAERREMLGVLETAIRYYQNQLLSVDGAGTREYLAGRSVDGELIKTFRLGYALDEWQGLVKQLEGKHPVAEKLGLIKKGSRGY